MKQIYVHGLGQTPDSWEKTAAHLAAAEDRMCPDLTKLVCGNEVTYENLYAVFSDYCRKQQGQVDLCGLSLGGVLALNFALDYPEKVHSLVLIAAQYKMPKKLLQFQNAIFRLMPKSSFKKTGFGKNEFLCLCKTMMELDFSDSLHKISCPVLVICGEKDSANKKASMELADRIGNARLQIIHGAGHEVNVDAPEKLAEAVGEFYMRLAEEES